MTTLNKKERLKPVFFNGSTWQWLDDYENEDLKRDHQAIRDVLNMHSAEMVTVKYTMPHKDCGNCMIIENHAKKLKLILQIETAGKKQVSPTYAEYIFKSIENLKYTNESKFP